ncbi:MAG: STAS domain-containing protein [Spirochaetota bacterium]
MQIDIHKEGPLLIFTLNGRYDISEVHNFETVYRHHIEDNPKIIALNLRDLKYIDSSGIGSLVRCMNLALKSNIEFICYDINENVESIFKIAKLDQFISILTQEEFIKKYIKKQ